MASIILHSVGAAVGNALVPGLGGAFLGALGRGLGGSLDGQLGLGAHVTGPRLDNLSVQDSRYGAGIPIIYGNARVAGNVIWSTNLMQATHTSSVNGGKGGGFGGGVTATTYTYSVHCAVGIALGPIGGVATIWADSTIIYQNGVWTSGLIDGATIYTGTTTQTPDPLMQSILGAGNVPAYRGLAYIVFDNLQLANFGNRLPNLTFEITPALTTTNPTWLGGIDAGIDINAQAVANGGMIPISTGGSGTTISTVLIGGFINPGANCQFTVGEFDVSGDAPVQLAVTQSASFATSATPTDSSWAMAPDGRFIAMLVQSATAPTQMFVFYDSVNRVFGNVYATSIASVAALGKPIGWIDAQHFVVDAVGGGVRGVHVFARAGLNIVDLGFTGVWGAGSAATRLPLFYAQYTPTSGGLINYMTDTPPASSYFTTIYACALAWQNNALVVGTPYVVASGLSTGTGSGPNANLLQTGANEWTLCFGTVIDFHLISFEPGATSATITRPWQDFTPSIGLSTQQLPLFFGDRLVIAQRIPSENLYRLSEIMLSSGSFSLTVNSVVVGNVTALSLAFCALPLDATRLLLVSVAGYAYDAYQTGIIQRAENGCGLDTILGDILTRCGYASGDYDVSALTGASVRGFILSDPMSGRAAIEPLQIYQPFDLIESNAQLKAVLRHATADASVPSGEWRSAAERKTQPPALQITRTQELDLPLEMDVDYIDPSRNFEINCQRARRVASAAQSVQQINLPVVTDAATAKQIAETRLYTMWAERELTRIAVSRAWLALDPGDVIDLGNGTLLRLTNVNQAGSLLTHDGFPVTSAVYSSAALTDNGAIDAVTTNAPVPSQLYLMDLPLLQSTDDQPGVYAAATGNAGWTYASLMRSADGVNYTQIAALDNAAIAGIAVTTLGNGSGCYMDNANTVNVQLVTGALASCTLTDFMNGANAAMLGGEIVQFQTATLIGPGLYTLSGLLRGRRGTESMTGTHATGENFVLLQSGAVEFVPALLTDRGASYDFRALSKGQTLGEVLDTNFTYGLGTIQPFSPVNITGTRLNGTGTDVTLVWKRRARINAEWVSYVDVPLDEPAELYDVEIMNGLYVMRTFSSIPTPTVVYSAAMQTADWGASIPASFTVNVYQISARYGRGKQGTSVV